MKRMYAKAGLRHLVAAFFMLACTALMAQTKVSGTVTDRTSGEALIGVNIVVKGQSTGTITDIDGRYDLNVGSNPPFTLVFSYTGYTPQEVVLNAASPGSINVRMDAEAVLMNDVVVSASRVEERILESPVSVEKLDAIAIRQSTAPDFYDGISNLKGVQTTQGSLTLTSINTRGFGAVANERFVQLIDGMDNAAPLLNFPTGNIVGISELDVQSVELVPGAASALYGPNAFNGILLMNSRNPFLNQGLSVQLKTGITTSEAGGSNPYNLVSARYAKAFGKFAFKLNASYLTATDWVANDYTTGRQTAGRPNPSGVGTPNFDGLNTYGDETEIVVPMAALAAPLSAGLAPLFAPQLGITTEQAQALLAQTIPRLPTLDLRRTGFTEADLLESNDANSLKLDGALHYKITDNAEVSYSYRWGSGSTVYQGGERYVLRDFSQQFHKLELSGSNYWLRGYMSQTDAGDSYNLSALGAFANERFKASSAAWVPQYAGTYAGALLPIYLQGGTANEQQLAGAHAAARAAANNGIPAPGTKEFTDMVNAVRSDFFQRTPPGAGFFDNSRMYHTEGGYNFKDVIAPEVMELLVGANYRQYDLFSDGTIFNEDPDGDNNFERITIGEYGAYMQAGKRFFNDHLKLQASLRYDKNENFDGQVSPRIAAVYTAGENRQHNVRASFQTGFRNPSTQNQFIYFPTGAGLLVGSTEANAARYGIHNGGAYTNASYNAFIGSVLAGAPNPGLLVERNIAYVQPEQLKALEVGYKGFVTAKFMLDVSAYYTIYNDFITQETVRAKAGTTHRGQTLPGVQNMLAGTATSATAWRPYINAEEQVTSVGFSLGTSYQLAKGYSLYGNYVNSSFDVENPSPGFEAGFNMPEHKIVVGLSNRKVAKNIGFDINYRWQSEFEWENSFAFGTIPAYGVLNLQASYAAPKIKTIFKIGGTNAFGNDFRTNAGGPWVGQMYYLSMTYDGGMK